MSDEELKKQRAAWVIGIERNNDLISQYGMKIKQLEDGIDEAQEKIGRIDEELELRRLIAFCNTPNLFAPIV
jgi:hypothetical protein